MQYFFVKFAKPNANLGTKWRWCKSTEFFLANIDFSLITTIIDSICWNDGSRTMILGQKLLRKHSIHAQLYSTDQLSSLLLFVPITSQFVSVRTAWLLSTDVQDGVFSERTLRKTQKREQRLRSGKKIAFSLRLIWKELPGTTRNTLTCREVKH